MILPFLAIPLMIVSCAAGDSGSIRVAGDPLPKVAFSATSKAYYEFLRGSLAELSGYDFQAIQHYEAGIKEDPYSTYLHIRMGILYFSAGKMSAALKAIELIQPEQIHEASVLLQLAQIYSGTRQPELALVAYDRAITLNPDWPKVFFAKGVLLLNLQRFQEARKTFEEGILLDPLSHVGHYFIGKALYQLGEIDQAAFHFDKAIQSSPHFEPSYQALATLLEEQQDISGAIETYERLLLAVNPQTKRFRQEIIRLLLIQRSYQRALNTLTEMVARDPSDLTAQVRIASIHAEMGHFSQAIDQLTVMLQQHPGELRIWDYLGLMYEETADYDQAMQLYEDNVQRDPTFYDSHLHLGFLAYRLKRYDQAIPHLIQAVELRPGSSEPHIVLGLAYLQSERLSLAISAFEYGRVLHPDNADLRFNLGAAYDKLDQFSDVVHEMEAVLTIDPHHADALNYLGYSYADRGIHIEEAVELTQRAVTLQPNNGYYVDSFGWALFKMGHIPEALLEIKKALVLVNDDPVIFEHLGDIYFVQQDREKAKNAWSRSLELDSTNVDLKHRFEQEGFGEVVHPQEEKDLQPQMSRYSLE